MKLGFYELGNGLTVADRDVLENGDYKKVAHINHDGSIRFFHSLPQQYRNQVIAMSQNLVECFKNYFQATSHMHAMEMAYESMTLAQQIQTCVSWDWKSMSNDDLYRLYVRMVETNTKYRFYKAQ